MNRSIYRVFACFTMIAAGVASAYAQKNGKQIPTAEQYVISAKAGKVNHAEGTVSVTRNEGRGGLLLRGDHLEKGERVATGGDSLAEVLLNPGSYLRLGENTEFEFKDTSLDDLRLTVHRGSAILEVVTTSDFKVTVYTPKSRVTIVNSGVYRVDVEADGTGLASVVEGRAVIGEKNVAIVKEGQTGTLNGGAVAVAKFDKNKRDVFADWSRSRAKEQAKMASNLKNKNVRTSLLTSFNRGWWGRDQSFGVWVYDPRFGRYCFLPYWADWYSPYGYSYGSYIWWYQLPINPTPVQPPRFDGQKTRNTAAGRQDDSRWGTRDWGADDRGQRSTPTVAIPAARPMVIAPPPAPTGAKDRPIN